MTTRKPAERGDEPGAPSTVLTIAYHPDLRRVGEVAAVSVTRDGPPLRLSRIEPDFAPVGDERGAPISDPHLSRRPFEIAWAPEGGLRLAPVQGQVAELDGSRLAEPRVLTSAQIDGGVVLCLAQTVVLVLHRARLPLLRSSMRFVGASDAIENVRGAIRRVADLNVPVLIRGETGTGKELIARAVVEAGPRARKPFLALNMAAIPASTAVAELFGHTRGAFTGAVEAQDGYFGEADGGTLFLDEVGLMPAELQAMLLRALETGEIQPVGGRTRRRVDVRFIAATDANLEQAVREGRFSEALLHRLSGFEVRVPPLRERREDIGRLLVHFLREELAVLDEAHRLVPADVDAEPWLPPAFGARVALYDWPGNVRQLRNVARQVAIASRGEPHARVDSALSRLISDGAAAGAGPKAVAPPAPAGESPQLSRPPSAISDDDLLEALRRNEWRPGSTAAELGISRTSLYVLIDRNPRIRKAASIPAAELRRVHGECSGDIDEMSRRLEVSRRGLQLRLKQVMGA
jgi:two-component system nitrogen regulation response regulator GlnG